MTRCGPKKPREEDKIVHDIVRGVWPNAENVEVEINTPSNIRVRIFNMYSPPGVTFYQLMELSEKFGTKQINAGDDFSYSGCETCDYGSEYGFDLDIRPEIGSKEIKVKE